MPVNLGSLKTHLLAPVLRDGLQSRGTESRTLSGEAVDGWKRKPAEPAIPKPRWPVLWFLEMILCVRIALRVTESTQRTLQVGSENDIWWGYCAEFLRDGIFMRQVVFHLY